MSACAKFFRRRWRGLMLAVVAAAGLLLTLATANSIRPLPHSLAEHTGVVSKNVYLDRHGAALNVTYENRWNLQHRVGLHDLPEFLLRAMLRSEDKRFFDHGGVDWLARLNALRQNLLAGRAVRGASTITEQVVRMLHPRPRNLWSRWIEGFEASALERRFSKLEILEFYLNQVPYAARRRGVSQAAGFYFDRDLSTLSRGEMLALAVLVRSPRWFDPLRHGDSLQLAIADLARRMRLPPAELARIAEQKPRVRKARAPADVSHFVRFAASADGPAAGHDGRYHTSIDLELQRKVQTTLDNQLERLRARGAGNGAVLVVDHASGEILSWVVGYAGREDRAYNRIDAVLARRQPGSTLKPLLYASAIEAGWTAATMLDDAPLEQGVGHGLHRYRNYSRGHYGPVSLREALGNSLNIPAVKAIQQVGSENFLALLYDLGIDSLSAHPDIYGDGLALGNGELSLYELVQAYTALARMGDYRPLSVFTAEAGRPGSYRVLSEDAASLIGDILSDPAAREKEFGWDSILNFPHQTAVKTGTSSDYRDAWAVGYNDRYTVGAWIGNLDYSPMDEITGASGAALVLRSIFNELNRYREVRPLYLSANLERRRVCSDTGLAYDGRCDARDEWFVAGTYPAGSPPRPGPPRLRKPSNGLRLAMDPRIPDDKEYFEFALTEHPAITRVRWFVNDELVAETTGSKYQWKVARGDFRARAEIQLGGASPVIATETVVYRVN